MAIDAGSAVGYLDLDITGFLNGLKSAQEEADKSSKNIVQKFGNNISNAGKSLTSAGKTLTKTVTVPILGAGTAVVKMSSNFESSMSRVQAISGATGKDLDALNKKAQELGASTAWSASEVADGMTEMAKAGWSSQQIIDGMAGVLDAASASGENLASVSTIVADAITGFGMEAKDATRIADLLTQAANSGTIDINDLGESFKYVAPAASTMGFSVEEVTTALSAMSMAGIKGSQAGTSLRGVLSRMTGDNKKVKGAMEELGIVITNSDGSFKSLNEIVSTMRGSFEGLTDEQKTYYATMIAGQEGQAGLLSLLNLTQEEYDEIAKSMENANGVARETADIMLNNLSGQVTLLKSALEGLAIQFGEIILPYLKRFVEWLQNLVQKLQELTPEQKEQIVKWAAFAAAIGPALFIVGKITTGIGGLVTAFGKLGGGFKAVAAGGKAGVGVLSKLGGALAGITGPILAVVAVIAVLAAAFTNLWKNNEEFRNKITAIWDGIKTKFDEFAQGIVDRLNALGFDFESLVDVLKAIWDGFCNFLAPIFEGAFSIISAALGTFLDIITGLLDVFIGLFTGNWEQMWNGIKEIFIGIWDGIVEALSAVGNTLLGLLDVICGWFGTTWEDTWNSIKEFFVGIWESISTFFKNIWNSIKTTVSNVVNGIKTTISNVFNNIKSTVTNIWNGIKTAITNPINTAKSVVSSVVNNVKSTISNGFTAAKNTVSNVFNNIKNTISNVMNGARTTVKNAIDRIKSFFNFQWSLPKLKMPHFSIVGKFSLNPPSVPKLSVDWYSKAMNAGMILNGATIFGLGSNGQLLGGGEAGSEVVVGTNSLMSMIMSAVSENNKAFAIALDEVFTRVISELIDVGIKIYDVTNEMLGLQKQFAEQGVGYIGHDGYTSENTSNSGTASNSRKGGSIGNSGRGGKGGSTAYGGVGGVADAELGSALSMLETEKFTDRGSIAKIKGNDDAGFFGDISKELSKVGNVFNFYSPKAIDEIEAARQIKKTMRDIIEQY